MATVISGDTGVSQIQDGTVTSAKIVNGAVTPAGTQVGALPSMIRVNTANGYGSTNNKIRRFINIVTNQGSDITYADSATLGASFTINTSGVYAISYTENFTTSNYFGVSLNTAQPTIGIVAITPADLLVLGCTSANDTPSAVSVTVFLPAGSIIRAHTVGGISAATAYALFTIQRAA